MSYAKFSNDFRERINSILSQKSDRIELCVVHWVDKGGKRQVYAVDNWEIEEEELIRHIRKAKRCKNTSVTVTEDAVIVERINEKNCKRVTATYRRMEVNDEQEESQDR